MEAHRQMHILPREAQPKKNGDIPYGIPLIDNLVKIITVEQLIKDWISTPHSKTEKLLRGWCMDQ
jgi:hypothetical protein